MASNWTRPMTAAGGALLAVVGAAIIAFAFTPTPIRYWVLLGGFVLGAIALIVIAMRSRGRFPKPTRTQITILYVAIAFEMFALWMASPYLKGERALWLGAFAIVAVHFLPMYWSHGTRIALLGLACLAACAAGLMAPSIPLNWVLALDGALKLVFGLWMLSAIVGTAKSLRGAAA